MRPRLNVTALSRTAAECLSARTTCAICMEPMVAPYTVSPCGHTFCGACIMRWVSHSHLVTGQNQQQGGGLRGQGNKPSITCPKCRSRLGCMPAVALDLQGILQDVVVQSMDEDELREWHSRHERWLQEKANLISVAEEVMHSVVHFNQGGLPIHLQRMRGTHGLRPETPALQMSFGGQQLNLADDIGYGL